MPNPCDITLAAVPSGQRLGDGCVRFSNNSTSVCFESASNGEIPDLEATNWIATAWIHNQGQSGSRNVWAAYGNANNYAALFMNQSTGVVAFGQTTGSVSRFSVVPQVQARWVGKHQPVLLEKRGLDITISAYGYTGAIGEMVLAKDTQTLTAQAFESAIRSQSISRFRVGHRDGSTNGNRWWGGISNVNFAVGDFTALTDDERILLMLDPQRLFSYHGFDPTEVISYGDYCDSSGVRKLLLNETQLANGDRLVCPFSGKYLSCTGTPASTEVAGAPYSIPGNSLNSTHRGTYYFNNSRTIKNTISGGWLIVQSVITHGTQAMWYLECANASGVVDRHPINIPYRCYFTDSSDSYSKQFLTNTSATAYTGGADTHCDATLCLTSAGLFIFPFRHSDEVANYPASGDTAFGADQTILLTDTGFEHYETPDFDDPFGVSYASDVEGYRRLTKTYSYLLTQGTRILELYRTGTSQVGEAYIKEVDFSDPDNVSVRRQRLISNTTDRRVYPSGLCPLSDGRACAIVISNHDDNNMPMLVAGIIVPLSANWTDTSEWYKPDGTAIGATLGDITLANNPGLHLVDDNDSFLPDFPENGVGMTGFSLLGFTPLTGPLDGFAIFCRILDGDRSSHEFTNSSGGTNLEVEDMQLRRFVFDADANTITQSGGDNSIFSIMGELEPGDWPQNEDHTNVESVMFMGGGWGDNKMIIVWCDPLDYEVPYNAEEDPERVRYGYQVKAALFHRLNSADPTQYITLDEPIYSITPGGTGGEGLQADVVGSEFDGEKSIVVRIIGGQYVSSLIDRQALFFDMTDTFPAEAPDGSAGHSVGFGEIGYSPGTVWLDPYDLGLEI
jgi:hypothetical protein